MVSQRNISFFIVLSLLVHGWLLLQYTLPGKQVSSQHVFQAHLQRTTNDAGQLSAPPSVTRADTTAAATAATQPARQHDTVSKPLPAVSHRSTRPSVTRRQPVETSTMALARQQDAKPPNNANTGQHNNSLNQARPGVDQQRVLTSVRHAIAANFYYPTLARQRGQQGNVQLAMRIESNGYLSHMRVVQSSGYGLLDNAAMRTLQRVNNVPDAVTWLDGHYLDMILPIEYRLE